MCSCVPTYVYINTMEAKSNEESFTTPIKESTNPIDVVVENAALPLSNIATDVSSADTEPMEVSTSTSTATDLRKAPPACAQTMLSPSSRTRSHSSRSIGSRKRNTPEKYVPSFVPTNKLTRSMNIRAYAKKRKKVATATTSTATTSTSKEKVTPNTNEEEIAISDDESEVVHAGVPLPITVPVLVDTVVSEYERNYKARKLLSEGDPDNQELIDRSNEAQRIFYKSLFKIDIRNKSNIKSQVWKLGICREIKVTEYGLNYMKTSKYNIIICCLIVHCTNLMHFFIFIRGG
jgi:hypothetical protein